jgi:acyl homoserine lactone synthase
MADIVLTYPGDRQLDFRTLASMYRLRHAVFHDRLGWDVTSDNGMEYDAFDDLKPIYILARSAGGAVQGCWRLLPSTGPYMLKDVFPQLLGEAPAPRAADVWEMSRFAVATEHFDGAGFGFSELPLDMMRTAVRFARRNGIRRYVTVTSAAIERLLKKLGVNLSRLGPALRIGRVLTVACTLEVDAISEFALFGTLPEEGERKVA